VGPIPAGTDLSLIERHLDRTLSEISPFRAQFSAIRTFPNTSIFYLEPFNRSHFDHLDQELRSSGIPFSEIRWLYTPHCTLCGGEPLSADAAIELASRSFPQAEYWINTVSVYQLDDTSLNCKLLCQRTLGA
jgi:2'-5' RNA ligase